MSRRVMAIRTNNRGVNRLSSTGIWRGHDYQTRMLQMKAESEQEVAAGRERARAQEAAATQRIVHPVIRSMPSTFRVIRLFMLQGHMSVEDIGACATEREALAISTREQWRAQVLDRNGKTVSDNFRKIEKR